MRLSTFLAIFALAACASSGYAIYNNYHAAALESETHIYGSELRDPQETHLGVWRDVAGCLGVAQTSAPWSLYWAVADSIKTDDGVFAYGLTETRDGEPVGVIFERPFWWNTSVISHELVHVISHELDHEGDEWQCVMQTGVDLPLRRGEPVR